MIIGNGLLAKSFSRYMANSDIVIFASGVSNSTEERESEFNRERILLEKTICENFNSVLVYFGSCSIFDSTLTESKYVIHKKKMESIIASSGIKRFFIFRLPQIVGKSNNSTLMNYILNAIVRGDRINLYKHARRNLVTNRLAFDICDRLIQSSRYGEYNIAYHDSISVLDIYNILCEKLDVPLGGVELIDSGSSYDIDIGAVAGILDSLGVTRNKYDYYTNVICEFFNENLSV